MEKPGWAPLVLSGAIPTEVTDLLAILIMALGSLEASLIGFKLGGYDLGPWILLLTVASTSALASFSNTAKRLREDLALFAYGGSLWLISLRYVLRGLACTLVAISPFMVAQLVAFSPMAPFRILSLALILLTGGAFYVAPSLQRIRSPDFVENYKG